MTRMLLARILIVLMLNSIQSFLGSKISEVKMVPFISNFAIPKPLELEAVAVMNGFNLQIQQLRAQSLDLGQNLWHLLKQIGKANGKASGKVFPGKLSWMTPPLLVRTGLGSEHSHTFHTPTQATFLDQQTGLLQKWSSMLNIISKG